MVLLLLLSLQLEVEVLHFLVQSSRFTLHRCINVINLELHLQLLLKHFLYVLLQRHFLLFLRLFVKLSFVDGALQVKDLLLAIHFGPAQVPELGLELGVLLGEVGYLIL